MGTFMSKFKIGTLKENWDDFNAQGGNAVLIPYILILGFFAVTQLRNIFDPATRCANAQNELQDAQSNESSERKQALAGKRASAGIAITDAMERTASAVSKTNRECKE